MSFDQMMLASLQGFLQVVPGIVEVKQRPLFETDANGACGISIPSWVSSESQIGTYEPLTNVYTVIIEHLVKHAVADEGAVVQREVANSIRRLLVSGDDVRVSFGQLSMPGPVRERFLKYSLNGQQYPSNKLGSVFAYMSVTTMTIETEPLPV